MRIFPRLKIIGALSLLTSALLLSQACGRFAVNNESSRSTNGSAANPNPTGSGPLASVAAQCDYRHLNISNHRTEIRSQAQSTMCAVPQNLANTDGNIIFGYDCSTGTGAPFRPVLQFDDCSFQIETIPINGVLCLDSGTTNGTGLVQKNCDSGAKSQRWTLVLNTDESYSLKTSDGRCIMAEGSSTNSVQFQVSTCDGSPAQNFTLPGLSDAIINPPPTSPAVNAPVITIYSKPLDFTSPTDMKGMTASGTVASGITFASPKPGGYLEYTVDASVAGAGYYSIQLIYASCLPNASTDVYVNGQLIGNMALPATSEDIDSGPDKAMVALESMAFPIQLNNGLNKIRLAVPAATIPFRFVQMFINYDGVPLPRVGYVTPVSPSLPTIFDISTIYRIYRFTLDNTLGTWAWRYPHDVAHIEYKINVATAGKYAVKVNYSSPSGQDSIDLALNDFQRISSYYTVLANIPLPSTGAAIGTFMDSPSVVVDLPAGVSRLDFMAHSGTDNSYVREYALAGISLTPVSP